MNDYKLMEFLSLPTIIDNFTLSKSTKDKRIWKGESFGQFSCKSDFECLIDSSSLPFYRPNLIWKTGVPTKMQVFTWLVSKGRINT